MGVLKRTNARGSVLILSLWIFSLLALLAGSLAYRMRIETRLSRTPLDESRLTGLAIQAVYHCADFWRTSAPLYTALNQPWNDNPAVFKNRTLEEGTYTAFHDGVYGIEDESARLDLNKASSQMLQRLFGVHADVVPAIVRWRENAAAARGDYEGLGYAARGGPFKSLDELRLVKGMDDTIFETVQPYLTVFPSGGVNLNTASGRVLEALGLRTSLVNKILWYRQGPDGRVGTTDDGVFESLGQVLPALQRRSALSEEDRRTLATLVNSDQLIVQSNIFRIRLSARLKNSSARREVLAISSARVAPSRIYYWREVGR